MDIATVKALARSQGLKGSSRSHAYRRARVVALASLALLATPLAMDAASAAAPGGLDIPGNILRSGDFNTGSLSQWNGSQQSHPYSIAVQRNDVREGGHAARFEVRSGDNPIGYGDRAEVQASTGESEGKERWYSWSTKFDMSFPRYGAWQVVSQWHANAAGSPPISFMAENDDLVLRAHRYSAPSVLIDIVDVWRGPMRRGQWQDIKVHVKWSGSDSTGFVELWIDDVRQAFDDGTRRRYIRTLYPGYGAYFKQGLYRLGGLSAAGIVYHDGFRMSDGLGGATTPTPDPAAPSSPATPGTPESAVVPGAPIGPEAGSARSREGRDTDGGAGARGGSPAAAPEPRDHATTPSEAGRECADPTRARC